MVESRDNIMGQHDLSYRAFFSYRRMVQDLLREIVGERWVDLIDLDSGVQVDGTFVSPKHENRESDVIWKFQRNDTGEPVYVYILMEFQSRPDPAMPVRLMSYVGLFYERLMSNQPAASWKKLPLVIPLVVYNGREPWGVATELGSLIEDLDPSAEIYRPRLRYLLVDESRYPLEELAELASPVAELFRIEQSRSWGDVKASIDRLGKAISPAESSLDAMFVTWFMKVVLPRFGRTEEAAVVSTLKEVASMLAENIEIWNLELQEKGRREGLEEGRQEGRQEGRREGRQEGRAGMLLRQLHLKFGALSPEIEERVRSTDADRLLEWSDRVLTAQQLQDVFGD